MNQDNCRCRNCDGSLVITSRFDWPGWRKLDCLSCGVAQSSPRCPACGTSLATEHLHRIGLADGTWGCLLLPLMLVGGLFALSWIVVTYESHPRLVVAGCVAAVLGWLVFRRR